ncbi:MAG TPA: TIGR02757 family protein [Candidatus Hydrogenedentes bacterium]|nr:TIGR02757 family protein [Candidatus Hydrogenedentota bacterium]HPG69811.1 TIGR02757 family protein [Candidatus Hydrogenedentota bacterium]
MNSLREEAQARHRYACLEELYARHNLRKYVVPDPLQFLYDYPDVRDREIAGLVAACLAYGRVAQILRSVGTVLERLSSSPRRYVEETTPIQQRRDFGTFRHRFTTGDEIIDLIDSIRTVLACHETLNACFVAHLDDEADDIRSALAGLVRELAQGRPTEPNSLLACPRNGSACKRMNLYLRWMVRRDAVDPGGWEGVPPAKLIVPLDAHMHRIGCALGFTHRRQADMVTALEVTNAFRQLRPDDPVRYDFALTRFGIRGDPGLDAFLDSCGR